MSGTDHVPPQYFFAELLLPLRHAAARRGIHYLKQEREPETYWRPVATRTGGLEKLTAANCGGDELLQRLGEYWQERGDPFLPRLVRYLRALRHDMADTKIVPTEAQPKLGDFVYPLF